MGLKNFKKQQHNFMLDMLNKTLIFKVVNTTVCQAMGIYDQISKSTELWCH